MIKGRPSKPDFGGRLTTIRRMVDLVSDISLWCAMAALALIVIAYNYEVITRYVFNTPTRWSAEMVSYLLLIACFLAMPRLTREGGHVAVTVMLETLGDRQQVWANRLIACLGASICLALTWIAAEETFRQLERGVRMMAAIPIPKALVSVWIVWGMGLSAIQFAFLALDRGDAPKREPAE